MKIKKDFVMRDVAGEAIVIAVGEESRHFKGMIRLNETGKEVWKGLERQEPEEVIVNHILEKYDATKEAIQSDVRGMIRKLSAAGVLEA